ncbi:MAG: hypothetical protein QQN41_06685, partial [Nitrosopumilus sp.]
DLLFLRPSKEQRTGAPLANIYVKTHTRDKDGYIVITPDCVSLSVMETEIDRLISELEKIRKEAKQKFIKSKTQKG